MAPQLTAVIREAGAMQSEPNEAGVAGLSTRAHVILLSTAMGFIFLGAGAQQAFLVPYLEEFTDWSALQRSLVIAMVYLSMCVFRLGNVYLLRTWPQWKCTLIGAATYAIFTVAMLGLYWVPSYPLALLAAAFWGWGGAAMWMGSTMQTLALADRARRHGTSMGVLYAMTHLGWALGTIVLGAIFNASQAVGLPWLLYLAAFVFTVIGVVIIALLPRPDEPLPDLPTWTALMRIMSRAQMQIAAFLLFASALAFGFVLGSFTDYVENAHGAQWLWIATFFYPFSRMVLSFASGVMTERVSQGTVLAVGFFGGAAGMAVPLLVRHPLGLAVTALMLGLLNGAVPVVSSALIGSSEEQKRRPLTYGAMFTWRDLGVVVAAVAGGILGVKAGSVETTFVVFAVVFALCGVVSLVLNRYAEQQG